MEQHCVIADAHDEVATAFIISVDASKALFATAVERRADKYAKRIVALRPERDNLAVSSAFSGKL